MAQRRHYSDEFKREAVALVDGGQAVDDVAVSLGVAHGTLWNWVTKAHRPALAEATPADATTVDRALYEASLKRIHHLEQEVEFLGKASAYFAGKAHRKP